MIFPLNIMSLIVHSTIGSRRAACLLSFGILLEVPSIRVPAFVREPPVVLGPS